ncbi:hypothetical protein [Nostoc sp.]
MNIQWRVVELGRSQQQSTPFTAMSTTLYFLCISQTIPRKALVQF